jgi:hypothetical protein
MSGVVRKHLEWRFTTVSHHVQVGMQGMRLDSQREKRGEERRGGEGRGASGRGEESRGEEKRAEERRGERRMN